MEEVVFGLFSEYFINGFIGTVRVRNGIVEGFRVKGGVYLEGMIDGLEGIVKFLEFFAEVFYMFAY